MSVSLTALVSQSLRVTTITSDTVITTTIPQAQSTVVTVPGQGLPWEHGTSEPAPFRVTEITVPTVIVFTVTVPESALASSVSSPSCSSTTLPPTPSAGPSGSPNTSHYVLVALATIFSLSAALVMSLGALRYKRRLARANVQPANISESESQEHGASLQHSHPISPPEVSGPEHGDTLDSGSDSTPAQPTSDPAVMMRDALPVGSISPFVKRYDGPRVSSPFAPTANIARPRKGLTGPSRPVTVPVGGLAVGVTAEESDGTEPDGPDHQVLDRGDICLSRTSTVGHSTAPPPYSQIGEREPV